MKSNENKNVKLDKLVLDSNRNKNWVEIGFRIRRRANIPVGDIVEQSEELIVVSAHRADRRGRHDPVHVFLFFESDKALVSVVSFLIQIGLDQVVDFVVVDSDPIASIV